MRRFELSEGTSNKFWEVDCEGVSLTVRFGRIGANGQVQTKTFASAAKAASERDKLIAEKTKKGYVEKTVAAKADAAKADAAKVDAAKVDAAKVDAANDSVANAADSQVADAAAPATPRAARAKKAATAATPGEEPGWIDAGKGYRLALREGKLVCKNARGQVLASVPKDVKDSDVGEQLAAVTEWLETHAKECIVAVETWMLRSLPTPRAVLEAVWDDPAWRAALENTVVTPVDAQGGLDTDRAGFLKGVDGARGIGLVNLDGESIWVNAPAIAVPHPVLLAERDEFRGLAVELALKQGISQLFRETFTKGKDVDANATNVTEFRNGKFAQLNHALGLCRRLGYRVRGGFAVTRTWEASKVCEARFWVGSDDPMSETYTDVLVWVDDKDRTLKLGEVGPVAYSEGMRMAGAVYAGRVVPKEGENA
jgi:predicted DNA-binding WGR domain protein